MEKYKAQPWVSQVGPLFTTTRIKRVHGILETHIRQKKSRKKEGNGEWGAACDVLKKKVFRTCDESEERQPCIEIRRQSQKKGSEHSSRSENKIRNCSKAPSSV